MAKTFNTKHIEDWSVYNAFILTFAGLSALVFKTLDGLIITFAITCSALIFINKKQLFNSKHFFGIANTITLVRLLIILISFLIIDVNNNLWLFIMLTLSVSLDFFDGIAARHFNEASFFGQYFDMEVDAFYVLLMCCYFFLFSNIPFWILIPGFLRYLFRIYTFFFPKKTFIERKRTYATVIAASFFIVLLLGLITKNSIQFFILLSGSIAIMTSFFIGIIDYHKQ